MHCSKYIVKDENDKLEILGSLGDQIASLQKSLLSKMNIKFVFLNDLQSIRKKFSNLDFFCYKAWKQSVYYKEYSDIKPVNRYIDSELRKKGLTFIGLTRNDKPVAFYWGYDFEAAGKSIQEPLYDLLHSDTKNNSIRSRVFSKTSRVHYGSEIMTDPRMRDTGYGGALYLRELLTHSLADNEIYIARSHINNTRLLNTFYLDPKKGMGEILDSGNKTLELPRVYYMVDLSKKIDLACNYILRLKKVLALSK